MNKTALKNFATNARNELLKKVEAKAFKIGITEENIKKAQLETSDVIYIDGKQLSITEKKQRDNLIQRIKEIGFNRVIEEVAYTWFNRFIALRFMEVNNYLPTKVRVLSSSNPYSPEPDIIREALSVDLDIDKELVYELKVNNKTEELFKYLIIKQCNSLNKYLPFLFETIEDYKEILFPDGLLAKDSFLREMTDVTIIPESDWEKVEIIGWLYQYYISEKKDQVFADLKKNIKISKENIPAATQLFTPHWIVRYMVENSLGRLWLESNPDSTLKAEWKYYLEEAEQEDEVKKKLEEIRYKNVNPEDITFLDPCCGSGHILVYAFDVFYDMYLEKGYIHHEIPKLILEKNLFGLDIDDRAVQLASFAVMMKAREKSRRVFGQGIRLNICAIQESNWMTDEILNMLIDRSATHLEQITQQEILEYLRDTFWDAKEYGSLLNIKTLDLDSLNKRLKELESECEPHDLLNRIILIEILEKIPSIILQTKIISRKYDVVCTNPPYMASSGMNSNLMKVLSAEYENSKKDLFAVMIEKSFKLAKATGIISMITMESWMFLPSFEQLRNIVLNDKTILSLIHMPYEGRGRTSLGINFGTSLFVLRNAFVQNYIVQNMGIRYNEIDDEGIPFSFPVVNELFCQSKSKNYKKIPGNPVAYWVNDKVLNIFERNKKLGEVAEPRQGMATSDNNKFLRYWYEVDNNKIGFNFRSISEAHKSKLKWFPYNKGGAFRKWYGNQEFVISFDEENFKILSNIGNKLPSKQFYFRKGITYTFISSSRFGVRYSPEGFLFDVAGSTIFPQEDDLYFITGFLCSNLTPEFLKIQNPTMNFQVGNIKNLPIKIVEDLSIKESIDRLVKENINISKADWDSFETSWDFSNHPLLSYREDTIEKAFERWNNYSNERFYQLKQNEEELNNLFIKIYELQGEMLPNVNEEEVTIRKAERETEIKSFISYAVGCMFGRFSLDEEGLVFAGGKFEPERYQKYLIDEDNIVPILSDAYFEDDIVSKFIDFVRVAFGEDTLGENLDYIANSLGRKDIETSKETIRRYLLNDFYKDHVQTYKKRPIYWLFTSGKQKAFNCLIYMHRYDKTTLSRIRTDYLHELQNRLDSEKKTLLSIIEGDGTAKEISNAKKELKALDLKIEELKAYDELLHHMADMQIEIDLDDGVAVNYAKFEGLVAKI